MSNILNLDYDEIEKKMKEVFVIQAEYRTKVYAALKNDEALQDYLISELSGIIAKTIVRIRDEVDNG